MKSIFKSKTMWFNVAAGAVYIAHRLGVPDVPDVDPGLLASVNLVLRYVTRAGISVP